MPHSKLLHPCPPFVTSELEHPRGDYIPQGQGQSLSQPPCDNNWTPSRRYLLKIAGPFPARRRSQQVEFDDHRSGLSNQLGVPSLNHFLDSTPSNYQDTAFFKCEIDVCTWHTNLFIAASQDPDKHSFIQVWWLDH